MIYTVGGIKGGTGKTTIATNFAVFLSKKENDVLLIDADDQETSMDFTSWRESTTGENIGFTAIKLSGESIRSQVNRLVHKYDHIIIDSGGRDTTSQRAALTCSNVFLLPFQPRSFDFWTITKTVALINEIRAVKPTELQVLAFLNRADVNSPDNREVAKQLKETPQITFIDQYLVNRKAFANAAGHGQSVIELTPQDEKATAELIALFSCFPITKNSEMLTKQS